MLKILKNVFKILLYCNYLPHYLKLYIKRYFSKLENRHANEPNLSLNSGNLVYGIRLFRNK